MNRTVMLNGAIMNRIVLNSRVSHDGVLRVALPVGADEADQLVQVTVDPVAPRGGMSREQWEAWVDSMAGSWLGDFERPPQGVLEEREPL